jgi:predicted deacylase
MADKRFVPGDAERVWYRDSDVPGPTALILGGVHGNEQAGIAVVKQIISGEFPIPLEQGRLIVALGNLAAIKADLRFTKRGVNLNRSFRKLTDAEREKDFKRLPYEVRRAQVLLPVLEEADSAFDLHGFRPRDGRPFIITEQRGFAAAKAIGAPFISSGWSTIEAGGSDGFMEEQGKIGLCYELSQLKDIRRGIPRGQRGVLRYLGHMGLIEQKGRPSNYAPQFVDASLAVLANEGFTWGPNHPYKSFQHLEPGELVAQNGLAPEDAIYGEPGQVIIFPSSDRNPQPTDEMFNLGTLVDGNGRPLVAA